MMIISFIDRGQVSDHSQSLKSNNEKEKRIVNRVIRCENHQGTLRNYNMKFSCLSFSQDFLLFMHVICANK